MIKEDNIFLKEFLNSDDLKKLSKEDKGELKQDLLSIPEDDDEDNLDPFWELGIHNWKLGG